MYGVYSTLGIGIYAVSNNAPKHLAHILPNFKSMKIYSNGFWYGFSLDYASWIELNVFTAILISTNII